MSQLQERLARLPAVDRVLSSPAGIELLAAHARSSVTGAVREVLDEVRERIRQGEDVAEGDCSIEAVAAAAKRRLTERMRPRLRRVVNATGVVLHTNLGRATLAEEAAEAAHRAATAPCTLEYELASGKRGDRDRLVEEHLCALTGAEAATVVNNNAGAVLIVLNTLAQGREVLVSRGELIEIGGSFRIPDIMAKSGARLREVGTTNRTHPRDYEGAIGPDTALLLKVHTSNYRIVGFTASVSLGELHTIASAHDLPVAEDLGAGAIVDLTAWGLPAEPLVGESLRAGADVVTASGDKLLGGPQCGIIAGRRRWIDRIRRNPLKRALRCDKMTLAALETTLRIYRFDPAPERRIPVLRALARPIEELEQAAAAVAGPIAEALGPEFRVEVERSEARAGSGSQPEVAIPSVAVSIRSAGESADSIARRFRSLDPPVIGRIEDDRLLLDLRAVEDPNELIPRRP
ncbi:MAG: L-seryl-tRNA(Sec) selenium transferase [Deltaproteobacteria bacterium]|nr:MAG: L-seryl-tRNA(Sec) selenium transferase [Deltaproteobacteria bacterium]